MAEVRVCAFIVTLISVVIATPYGYGVKGGAGASSRADSSAVAGSFGNRGDIPHTEPFGGAYSGSFSKSSSSSSSSSSASSSSSSSSFSYNGFGTGSFPSPGTKCNSGTCQDAGHHGVIEGSADFHGYNTANTVAAAGSGGASGVNCQGSQCAGSSDKCSSGQCQPKLPVDASASVHDDKKCSSGQCSSSSQAGSPASQYDDSDDIRFVAHLSKSAYDSKDHSLYDKTRSYSGSSECLNGNCSPSTINAQPTFAHGSPTPYPTTSNSAVTPGYNLPATHLETPHLNSGCNSGNCNTGHGSPPTSYSVPVHGSPTQCSTPGCSNKFSSPSDNSQSQYNNNTPEKNPIYSGGFGGPSGLLKPNEFNIQMPTSSKPVHFANPTHSTPSIPITGCKSSNCFGSPTTLGVTSTTTQSGSYNAHKESGNENASSDKNIYTGGFGGPPGMLKPDEYDITVPIHSTNPSYNNHSPSPSVSCNTPNCNTYTPKPMDIETSSKLPPYIGGFGGPPGILKPNVPHGTPSMGGITPQSSFGSPKPITVPQNTFPGSTNNHRPIGVIYPGPLPVAPITPSYTHIQAQHPTVISSVECNTGSCANVPGSGTVVSAPSGPYGSSGCKSGDCAGYPTTGSGISAPSGPYGHTVNCKTGTCAGSDTESGASSSSGLYGHADQAGCKTGNCAIPTHMIPYEPHGVKYPNIVGKPSNPQYTGEPSESILPCKTSNCANTPTYGGVSAQSGTDSASKEKLPVYTGGFGGPPGLLKPNDYSMPDVTATLNNAFPGISTPVSCASGNCESKATSPSPASHTGAHGTAESSASADAVAYSGGFGGPPGLLIPYDNGKVDLSKTVTHNQLSHYGTANMGAAGQTGTQSNTGSLGGSAVGTTALSGSSAIATSGSYGRNTQGSGIKGGSPCGGGCGSGYHSGLNGSGSSAAAGAKSVSSSGAFGGTGSFASSSASAHSSVGAYTKGGYGKR